MTTAALVGSTGLVGSHILSILLSHPSISTIHAYTRRDLANESPKLHPLQSTDTSTWASIFPKAPAPQVFYSALGTTQGAAGGTANQRKIDYDLNLELAKAAKDAGVETYVLISSATPNAKSRIPYSRMKGELEEAVKELGFKHLVLLRPGLIVGQRHESRPAEAFARAVAGGLGKLSRALVDPWAQDADVIARAAVNVGLECVEGKREDKVIIVPQADIIKHGRESPETK